MFVGPVKDQEISSLGGSYEKVGRMIYCEDSNILNVREPTCILARAESGKEIENDRNPRLLHNGPILAIV